MYWVFYNIQLVTILTNNNLHTGLFDLITTSCTNEPFAGWCSCPKLITSFHIWHLLYVVLTWFHNLLYKLSWRSLTTKSRHTTRTYFPLDKPFYLRPVADSTFITKTFIYGPITIPFPHLYIHILSTEPYKLCLSLQYTMRWRLEYGFSATGVAARGGIHPQNFKLNG